MTSHTHTHTNRSSLTSKHTQIHDFHSLDTLNGLLTANIAFIRPTKVYIRNAEVTRHILAYKK